MSDEIRLVLPAQEDFHQIARLVVGGLAARLELTYEQLADLEVGLDAVLGCRDDDGELSISLAVEGRTVKTTVGPFSDGALADLDRDGTELGLRRVLETVTDAMKVEQRDGGYWVELTKGPPA